MTTANPYAPPAAPPPPNWAYLVPDRLQLQRAIEYIWESPNWVMNILFLALCMLAGGVIPIVPAIVAMGYQFDVIESLLRYPQQPYPDFKADRIVEYLSRGIQPALVGFIAGAVAGVVLLVAVGIPVGITAGLVAAVGEEGAPIVLLIAIPLVIVLTLVVVFLVGMAAMAMVLRAGLSQDLGSAFDAALIKNFTRLLWREVLLAGLFLMAVGFLAEIAGLMMFCVGVFVTFPIVQLVQAHLMMQLYRLYVARGGEKFPLKPAVATATVV
jgi:hypothetical protein